MNSVEVVIPAFNEQENIAEVIKGVRRVLGDKCLITVVDDASEDKTAQISSLHGARLIRHPYRIGNGACIKTGLRNAQAEIVVFMDADGQHQSQDIPRLLDKIDRFDMVIGARDFSKIRLRNLANILYNLFAGYMTHFKVRDLTSGFRALKRSAAMKFIYLVPNGFSYPTTLTLAFLKTGRTIKYVPISPAVRKSGKSKINLIKDGIRFFIIITRIATFFSPLRFFLPISAIFFATGLAYYIYTYSLTRRFTNMSALLFTTSVIIFMLGLVSEQIAQLRMDRTEE